MAFASTTVTFAAPPSSFFRSHLRSCLPPPPSSPSSPPSVPASPLTRSHRLPPLVLPPFGNGSSDPPSAIPPPPSPTTPPQPPSPPLLSLSTLSLSSSPTAVTPQPLPLHLLRLRRAPPVTAPPSASVADNSASATGASPLLSLSFSFVRSTVRLPPLRLSPSISASISSAEHRWPPPSPSSPLYPHLSHHDCHHPCFPSSFPWCRRHLSAPSIAGFSSSSPLLPPFSTTALPLLLPASVVVSRRCRHRHEPPSPSSLPITVNPLRPL